MEFKVDFKSSDMSMRADFGAVTELEPWQKASYEKKIARLETEKSNAYEQGANNGSRAAYDFFWDEYQEDGKRSNYSRAFGGSGWNDNTFLPKYNVTPVESAAYMFAETGITDLGKMLDRSSVSMDLSRAKRTDYMFHSAKVTHLPWLDVSSAANLEYMFYKAEDLHTIDKLVFSPNADQTIGNRFFYRCISLENVTFDGFIGCDVDIRYSPLSRESIYSLLWHLSTEVSDKTVYFSKAMVNKRFETSEGANDGAASEEWMAICRLRPTWLFQTV